MIESKTCVQINIPLLFQDPDFLEWLNSEECGIATWHKKGGEPGQFSDCFMTLCYESQSLDRPDGSDSDMPQKCFEAIINKMIEHGYHEFEGLVWLTNLEE